MWGLVLRQVVPTDSSLGLPAIMNPTGVSV